MKVETDKALVERLLDGPYTIGKSTGDIVELRQAATRIEAMADEIEALRKGDGYAKAIEDSAAKAESMAPVTSNHAAYTIAAAIRALAGKDASQ